MPEYQALQVGEYELADVDYNKIELQDTNYKPFAIEKVTSVNLFIKDANVDEFGSDIEVVETIETINRNVKTVDTLRYRRVQFSNFSTENHTITNVHCKLYDTTQSWTDPKTTERITNTQYYTFQFDLDGYTFKTKEGVACYFQPTTNAYIVSFSGNGTYQDKEIVCALYFKVKLATQMDVNEFIDESTNH